MTPSPLPVQLEELVVVQIINGQADLSIVHLPADRCNKGGSRFDSYDFAPATWPAACGVGSGSVYVRAEADQLRYLDGEVKRVAA